MAQWVKGPVSSQLWHGFGPWPRNFCRLQQDPPPKKKTTPTTQTTKTHPTRSDPLALSRGVTEAASPVSCHGCAGSCAGLPIAWPMRSKILNKAALLLCLPLRLGPSPMHPVAPPTPSFICYYLLPSRPSSPPPIPLSFLP